MMLMRTAKSCRSDAPMPASSLREDAQATVSNKHGHRGEREVSRKTIARGMPGDFRCDRGDYARVLFLFAREAAGASSARHSLRPLFSERQRNLQNPGEIAPRDRGVVFEIGATPWRGATCPSTLSLRSSYAGHTSPLRSSHGCATRSHGEERPVRLRFRFAPATPDTLRPYGLRMAAPRVAMARSDLSVYAFASLQLRRTRFALTVFAWLRHA